jgi:hypothetical protein
VRAPRPAQSTLAWLSAVSSLLIVILGGWLLAAPPGASPDDGYHLGSIWCADGFKEGICIEDVGSQDSSRALVPQPVLEIACFTYDGSRSAACQLEALSRSSLRLVSASTNIDGARPSLYYRTMHLLIGDGSDVATATARIRVANAAVAVLLVALTALVATHRLRIAFLLSWLISVVPLGLFLITSVNTSAWGIIGLTTAWANVITVTDHHRLRNRTVAAGLAGVGVIMAIGSRTEAVAHVGIIAATLVALLGVDRLQRSGWRLRDLDRRTAIRLSAAVAGLVVMAATLVAVAPRSAGLDGVLGDLREGYDRIAARGVGDPFLSILFEVPTLWAGALGNVWGLGALDTPIPSLASFPLMGMFVGLVAIGLHRGARARTVAVTLLFAALLVFPTFSLLRVGLLVYEQLQPRQFMALLFPLLGIALYRLKGEPDFVLGSAGRITAVLALGLAHSMALLVTIQRHTSGLLPGFLGEPRHVALGREIEWWWASAPHPDVVWILGSLAYMGAVMLVVRRVGPDPAR